MYVYVSSSVCACVFVCMYGYGYGYVPASGSGEARCIAEAAHGARAGICTGMGSEKCVYVSMPGFGEAGYVAEAGHGARAGICAGVELYGCVNVSMSVRICVYQDLARMDAMLRQVKDRAFQYVANPCLNSDQVVNRLVCMHYLGVLVVNVLTNSPECSPL